MNEQLNRVAANLGIGEIRQHIFLCCDQSKPKVDGARKPFHHIGELCQHNWLGFALLS